VSTIASLYHFTGRDPRALRYLLVGIALATCFLVFVVARELIGYFGAIVSVCLFGFSELVFRFTAYYQYEILFAFLLFLSGFLVFFRLRGGRTGRWNLPALPSKVDLL